MMYLCLDFGNTLQKAAVMADSEIMEFFSKAKITVEDLKKLYYSYVIQGTILSSVVNVDDEVIDFLQKQSDFIQLSYQTPLPIQIRLEHPERTGADLIAACVGARHIANQQNILIIQAGTCITHQWLTAEGVFEGGSISPGIAMRFKSLHQYTAKLPLITKKPIQKIMGKNTEEAILAGVIYGVSAEINQIIQYYRHIDVKMLCFLCGGDANFLENYIKFPIFANSNLVLKGLNYILDYHFEKQ